MAQGARGDGLFERGQTRTLKIEFSLRSVFTIILVIAAIWILWHLWKILLVLVVATVLAGTFSPVVDWLERHRVRRPFALAAVLVGLLGAVVGIGFLVIPALVGQIGDLIDDAPAIQRQVADWMAGFPMLAERAERVRQAHPDQYLEPVGQYALSYAQAAVELVAYGVTTVVVAFYMIADRERVQGFVFAFVPRRYHLRLARVLLQLETVVGGYVRGQAITSLSFAVFTFILLLIMRVPNALALAIFGAFTNLIPIVGVVLAITPAVLSALSIGPLQAVIVLGAMSAYQEFESRVLLPRVYGLTMRLSAIAVIVALLVGAELMGVIGALLALPIAAGLRVLVEELRIELPGDQPGEEAQRALDAQSERYFMRQATDASAVESAVMATELANQLLEEREEEEGRDEIPPEEESDRAPQPGTAEAAEAARAAEAAQAAQAGDGAAAAAGARSLSSRAAAGDAIIFRPRRPGD